MKNFNSFFNQLTAMPKRLAMVLTVLFTLGVGSVLGAGSETFENASNSTSYGSVTWKGDNGLNWSASSFRTDQKITGNRGLTSKASTECTITMPLTTAQRSEGMGVFTFKYKYPYSDSGKKNNLSFTINGTTYTGTVSYNSNAQTVNVTVNQGNLPESITINIASGGRACFDDFSWTSYVSADPYTVTLKDDNSTLPQSSAGESVTLPPRNGCDGYTFVGWTKSWSVAQTTWTTTAPIIIPTGSYTPTANENLYPVYTKTETTQGTPTTTSKTYTHTITAKTWSANGAQTLNNVSWTLTNDGNYYGYDGTKGQQVGSGSSPAKSMTLTTSGFSSATKITAVRISTSGASSISGSVGVTVGSTAFKSGTATTKSLSSTNTEYEFTGSSSGNVTISWSQTSSKAIYFKAIEVDYQTTTGGGNTTTTSYISVPDCTTKATVDLYHNDGNISEGGWTLSGNKYTQTVETTDDFTLPTPVKEGYTFGGWYESSTFSGSAVTEIEAGTTGTKEFWAKWTAEQYTVQLDDQGATTAGTTSVTATYNAAMPSIANNLPKKTGSTFLGYFTATSGGTKYYNADGTSAKNWDKTSTATLYAQWECVTPTISTQPQSATYLRDDDADALSVVAAASDATLTYQWQKSTDNSTWSDITGATEATYKPSTQSVGTTYYQVVVTNSEGNCSATSDVATITVRSANCKWVETEIGDIESGDEVVVVMAHGENLYALPYNSETASNSNPIAILITTDDFAGTIVDEVIWYITKGEGNIFTLSPKTATDKYLTCNSSGNAVRINSTGNNKTFTIENDFLKNINFGTYLAISTAQPKDWRHYASTNQYQTLKLYKKECLPTGKYWINYDLTNVVCTDDPIKNKISTDDNAVELNFEATGEHNELPPTIIVTNGSTTLAKNTDYTWEDGVLTILNPSQITDNITISIAAQKRKYTVTFDANGHGSNTSQLVIAEGTASEPTAPEATGYTFVGWYTDSECTNVFDFATPITGDITLYAKWTVNKYTITFKDHNGTELQSSEVAYGETPSYTGETPTREQTAQYTYTFSGWSPALYPADKDQEYTAQFNTSTRQYTVTWYDGTGNAHKTQSADYNAIISVPATDLDPCDDAYPHFIGWTADPIVGSTTTQPTLVENVKVTGDCDYYAVFAKGEGGSSNYQKVTTNLDDWSGEYLIVYEAGNVAFNGGLTTLDAVSNTIGVTISDNTIESTSTTDAARFTIAAVSGGYTIQSASGYYIGRTANSNGLNSSNSETYTNTISYSSTVSINGSSNGSTTALKFNNASNQNRFRYYTSGQQSIALYKKGSGVNYTSFITTCCTSWTAPTLTYATPLNAEERQTAQPQFGNGTTYGNPTYTSSKPSVLSVDEATGEVTAVSKGTATITVTWEGDETYCSVSATSNTITVNGSYSVTFQSNGGTGTMEPQKADPSTQLIAKLNKNEFTKAGYVFVGWKDASGNAYTDEQENITLTKNLTLYAQWAAIVTLNDAGNVTTTHPETAGGSITLEDGANACDPYEFVGWTTVATGDWNEGINEPALVATTYTPNAPTTLYAVYKIQSEGNANAFKLSFEGGNGKTYYVGSYNSSPYLRGYSNITKEEAVTFIRTKMYPDNDTKYYIYMEHKSEYLYYNGTFNSTSSTPDENQGWVFHTVGDKIKLQSTYSYDPEYLSFSDRDQETINMGTNASGSEFNMLSAVTSTYVASPLCNQKITITFETGNGDFVDNAPKPNPLTVNRGDVITLPTCEYPGYEFMGWMKDEQQLDPSDIIGTYYTGDYTVDGVSSTITFYAYYKVIPEEVEFTGKDDVELLMYYYDGTENYYYAVSHAAERGELSSKQNCFNATTWTFTSVGNMQYYIQDETGKYLGTVSDSDNDFSLSNTPKIWNFTLVNGLWKMVCEDSPSRALMYISEGNRFTNAAISNEGNGAYSYVTLGICPYPTYTTNPVLSQGFSITNTAMVTSASGQKVKATSALTLETRNIELPCTFTISAPNITFYDNMGAEVTQLTSSAASEQFELHFAYKPTAENTMEYPTITIVDDEMKTYTIKNRIYARSLPNTFAVVAKVGGIWYALPSQGLNSTTPPAAYPVEVDNVADPTAVAAIPANADWSLRQVYEASRVDATKDRFVANGENFVFVNNEGTPKALNASASGNYLLTDAQYSGYYETNPGLYEWTPTTSDLETYTLTNAQRTDRTLNVSINAVFGVHSDNKATTEVRFLPIQGPYTPMAAQVVEWKENSVVVMYNGDPAQTASVSVNGGAVQTTELSGDGVQKDIAVYELAANGLATNPTQRLSITIGTEKAILPIPYIVSSETTDLALLPGDATVAARQEVAKVADLVVLKDAKLTADGTKGNPYKFRNVTIYGGGSLVIPSDKGFGANSLTMRVGGVEDGEYVYTYPQLDLNGTINSGNINLDLMTTNDYYYPFSVPYEVTLTDIHYPVEIYGSNVKPTNKGSFLVSYYDGEARSQGNTGWKDVEEQGQTVLSPHVGYSIWGLPKKVSVNGATSVRQTYGIHRIPMKKAADVVMSNETTNKNVNIFAHNATRDNDKGWNFIGNPYLVQHGGLDGSDTDVYMGLLVKEMKDGQWTGGWVFNGEQVRYVTQTNDCLNYTSTPVANATIPAFSAFFIQAKETGAIAFTSPNVAAAQSLTARHSDENKEITTGIILSGEKHSDRTGLLIADEFTEAYEFNADLSKFDNQDMNLYTISPSGKLAFMAINEELAKQTIPLGYSVSADGMYTIAFDEQRYSRDDIYALYLIDYDRNETTNLLHMDYDFYSETGANAERFALQVAFAPSTTTDIEYTQVGDILVSREGNTLRLDNLPSDATVTIYDAVGHLIEQHTATQLLQLTLQKGYYLLHIGNNQHSVVMDTFIP